MNRAVILLVTTLFLTGCAMYPELSKLEGVPPLQSRSYAASYKDTYFAAIDSASTMHGHIASRSFDSGEIIIDADDRYVAKVSVIAADKKTLVEFRIDEKYVADGQKRSLIHADHLFNGITETLLRDQTP
jgi:hypothetical protein